MVIDLRGLAIGIGTFIIILGIMGVVIGETRTSINSADCNNVNVSGGPCLGASNINLTLEAGVDSMVVGSRFGSTLMIVGVLAGILGLFALVR